MKIKVTSRWTDRVSQPERRVDAERLGTYVSRLAVSTAAWQIDFDPGGGEHITETAVAVSDPGGLTVVWIGRTYGGAPDAVRANSALIGSAHVLGLVRMPEASWDLPSKTWDCIKAEHAKYWTPIEKLASQAE